MNDNKSAYNSGIYDKNIVSTLPYYLEYHNQIIDLVKAIGIKDIEWLDTGCGTGTLACRVFESRDDSLYATRLNRCLRLPKTSLPDVISGRLPFRRR